MKFLTLQLVSHYYPHSILILTGYISRFNRVQSTEGLTLTCASYSEVPTEIAFYKNNTRISVDGFMYSVSQRVTNFATTSYETTLLVRGDPEEDIIGRYSCGLTGGRRSHITIQGESYILNTCIKVSGPCVQSNENLDFFFQWGCNNIHSQKPMNFIINGIQIIEVFGLLGLVMLYCMFIRFSLPSQLCLQEYRFVPPEECRRIDCKA